MTDYTLYYWPLPFRGQFVRATLAHIGARWTEAGFDETMHQRASPFTEQPIPHIGPPVLTDHASGASYSQLPAVLGYLGLKHDLMGPSQVTQALCLKVIGDANDVLGEMTRANGAQMWTPEDWRAFKPRLAKWMQLFEYLGARHALKPQTGHLLGTPNPTLADLVTATHWGTMVEKFPSLAKLLEENAPAIAGLTQRIRAHPAQAKLIADSAAAYGNTWCSGQIEASLRAVTGDA